MPNLILSVSGLSQTIVGQRSGNYSQVSASAPSVDIQITHPTRSIAPVGIFFDAEVSGFSVSAPVEQVVEYDPTKTEIIYYWNVVKLDTNDQPIAYQSQYDVPEKLYDVHRNATKLFGANIAHVFEQPGRYQVTVEAHEPSSGKTATAKSEILTVEDPDVAYAGAQTFYVDPDGDYSLAPAGAGNYMTISAALYATRNNGSPVRVMLADDKLHLSSNAFIFDNTHSILFARSGFGTDKPRVSYDYDNPQPGIVNFFDRGGRPVGNQEFLTMSGIDFVGYWNPGILGYDQPEISPGVPLFTNTVDNESAVITAGASIETLRDFFIVHDCSSTGQSESFDLSPTNVCHKGVEITNWRNIGLLVDDNGHFAILGSSFKQSPFADNRPGPRDGTINEHGPIRFSLNHRTFIDGTEMFSRTGWTGIGDGQGNGYSAHQPCVRWNQNMTTSAIGNIQRCRFEGGFEMFDITPVNYAYTPKEQSLLIERCEFIGSNITRSFVSMKGGGVTVRNNHMLHVNAPRFTGTTDPDSFVDLREDAVTDFTAAAAPVRVHHNTMVSLCELTNEFTEGDGEPVVLEEKAEFTDVLVESNIVHATATGYGPYAPMATVSRPDADYLGYSEDLVANPLPNGSATPLGSIAFYYPVLGSDALGAGNLDANATLTLEVVRDFDGNLRPLMATIGAFELV